MVHGLHRKVESTKIGNHSFPSGVVDVVLCEVIVTLIIN
jgi:hypothetical protein